MAASAFFDRVLESTTTTGTGTLTLAGAITGYQSFSVIGNLNTTPIAIWEVDANGNPAGAWEVAKDCPFTLSGTTMGRGTFLASSTGSVISFAAGTKRVAQVLPAEILNSMRMAAAAVTPGIRLTLTQGVPITTADVTAATSIFAEPVAGGVVPLFTDTAGLFQVNRQLAPSTLSLALGTLASASIPNDVFAYDNAGTVALEKLAWTSTSARATALVLSANGNYYKSGDFTRLYVGSFAPTATTTTEDSLINRFLSNRFNKAQKRMIRTESTSHTINNTAAREWNNTTASRLNFLCSLVEESISISDTVQMSVAAAANPFVASGVTINSTTAAACPILWRPGTPAGVADTRPSTFATVLPVLGLNFISTTESESATATCTMTSCTNRAMIPC